MTTLKSTLVIIPLLTVTLAAAHLERSPDSEGPASTLAVTPPAEHDITVVMDRRAVLRGAGATPARSAKLSHASPATCFDRYPPVFCPPSSVLGHRASPLHAFLVEPSIETARPAPSAEELQAHIEAYTRSIFQLDSSSEVSVVLSTEVLTALAERNIDFSTFIKKQRTAMTQTFSLAAEERPVLEVAAVLVMGDAVRVTLRFRGEDLKKPIYFVRESGAFKLNFAPPGFWKAVPENALFATHSYNVNNVNLGGDPFTLVCVGDARVTVAARTTGKISCKDDCGSHWYSTSGTTFQDLAGIQKKCDWNWWGDDVVINQFDPSGWRCNDPC